MTGPIHAASGRAAVAALLLLQLAPARVHAHPEAAESPEFQAAECIERVDLRQTDRLALPYAVPYDDVDFTEGDIVLPDAKTHQFFAFRGALAPYLLGSQLFPFGEASSEPRVLPEWITQDDVDRAAAASDAADATGFIAEQVELTDVLEQRSDLAPLWLRITADAARVPILTERGELGLSWDLREVPPGAYQVAGYVFSPPYNAWAARPGVIKIMDGTHDFPALALGAIDGTIYGGQGRQLSGCLDAPEGTRLAADFRREDQPGQAWQRFDEEIAVVDGRFELCFRSPDPALSGVIRVRVEAIAPDGTKAFAHSPDTLVLVATPAKCTPSASVCCEETPVEPDPQSNPDPPGMQPSMMEPMTAPMPMQGATAGEMESMRPPATGGAPATAMAPSGGGAATADAEGCHVARVGPAPVTGLRAGWIIVCAIALASAGFRRRRRSPG